MQITVFFHRQTQHDAFAKHHLLWSTTPQQVLTGSRSSFYVAIGLGIAGKCSKLQSKLSILYFSERISTSDSILTPQTTYTSGDSSKLHVK